MSKKLYPNQPNTGCHARLHPWWPRLFLEKYTCKTTKEKKNTQAAANEPTKQPARKEEQQRTNNTHRLLYNHRTQTFQQLNRSNHNDREPSSQIHKPHQTTQTKHHINHKQLSQPNPLKNEPEPKHKEKTKV